LSVKLSIIVVTNTNPTRVVRYCRHEARKERDARKGQRKIIERETSEFGAKNEVTKYDVKRPGIKRRLARPDERRMQSDRNTKGVEKRKQAIEDQEVESFRVIQ
jgi:hypothetical protein